MRHVGKIPRSETELKRALASLDENGRKTDGRVDELVAEVASGSQAEVTLASTDGEAADVAADVATIPFGQVISDPPTDVEVQQLQGECANLRDEVERLATEVELIGDDVRAVRELLHAIRSALVTKKIIKGGA